VLTLRITYRDPWTDAVTGVFVQHPSSDAEAGRILSCLFRWMNLHEHVSVFVELREEEAHG
jgi:hypothetical protein